MGRDDGYEGEGTMDTNEKGYMVTATRQIDTTEKTRRSKTEETRHVVQVALLSSHLLSSSPLNFASLLPLPLLLSPARRSSRNPPACWFVPGTLPLAAPAASTTNPPAHSDHIDWPGLIQHKVREHNLR